ncbi:hypothetical protein GIB67_003159 [Kingdonia uniflora]|uniref:Uncharacterized protein n=1 Tax=Kingdonia uniflora TaxID=39325 RepID=A0A7J7N684_9MAGN|nr:hypothetical protein GIB67_003159 [Kingdonia uniflora]
MSMFINGKYFFKGLRKKLRFDSDVSPGCVKRKVYPGGRRVTAVEIADKWEVDLSELLLDTKFACGAHTSIAPGTVLIVLVGRFKGKEKRLERLIEDANLNPKDAVKQSALLTELNKHSPQSVIRRFEQRDHAIDSKGVAEYLRALLQELKQRASGNMDEILLSPGISEKQPLHVIMIHGLLHLLGFDHEISDEVETEMESEEEHLLISLGWKGKRLIQCAADNGSSKP